MAEKPQATNEYMQSQTLSADEMSALKGEGPLVGAVEAEAPAASLPEPKPEPKAATPEAKEEDGAPEGLVSHKALHAERQERKKAEQENTALREKAARFDERLAMLTEAMRPQPETPKATEIPDPEKDALGALKMLAATVRELQGNAQQNAQQREQEQKANNLRTWAAAQERQFIEQTPDYNDASRFMVQSRGDELKALGYTMDQINTTLQQESAIIAVQGYQQGRNPAEMIFHMAKARGFAPKAPAGPTVVKADAADPAAIAKLASDQRANLSLGGMAGSPPSKPMTGEDIVNLPDDEFMKMIKGKSQAEMRRLFGS